MNKNAKRLLCLALCLMLVLSVLPVAALAADTLRVYCQAPANWTNCNAYWWGSADSNPSWPGNAMEQNEDGLWYIDIPADTPNIIFNNGKGTQSADLKVPTDDNLMYVYNTKTWAPCEKQDVEEPEVFDFYVAGQAALCGSDWNCADSANGMSDKDGDGIYTKLYTGVAAGTYEFKVTNGTWDSSWGKNGGQDNYQLVIESDNASLEIRFDSASCLIICVANGTEVGGGEDVEQPAAGYYVAGDFNGWNCCDSNYIMTGDENGIYYLDVVLTAGKHSLKVTDGTWANSWGGTGEGGNYDVELAEDGTAHIIFDSVNFIVNVEGVLPPPAPEKLVINSVHVVGTAGLVGVEWDPTANEMTGEDGIYTITFTGIYAGTYDFKFAANGAWDINWGTGAAVESGIIYEAWFKSTGNSTVTVHTDNATVTLVLDLFDMDEFTGEGAMCTVIVEEEEVPTEDTYYVAGSFNEWYPAAEDYKLSGKDGIYSITLTLTAGSYEFKVTKNGTWDESWGDNGNNVAFKLNADGKVTITFDANTQTVTVDGAAEPDPLPIESIHAVGQAGLVGTDWDPTANQMTGENGIYTITFTGVAAGTYEFKFAANGAWAINWASGDLMVSGETYDAWFNAMGNSKVEVAENDSTVTLTLDLTAMDAVTGNGAKCSVTVAAATVGGVTVSGKISSGRNTAGAITVELFAEGSDAAAYSVTTEDGNYSIVSVVAGTYTMKISKANHVTRSYTITVGGEDVAQDGEIRLLGDVNGNGRVEAGDVAKLFAYTKGGAALADDYAMECANANGGKLNIGDVSRIYAHVTGKNPLF